MRGLAHVALVAQEARPGFCDVAGRGRGVWSELFEERFHYEQVYQLELKEEEEEKNRRIWDGGWLRTRYFPINGVTILKYEFIHVVRI